MHFVFRNEFIFRQCSRDADDGVIGPGSKGGDERVHQLMTILDVGGIGFSDLNQDVIRLYEMFKMFYGSVVLLSCLLKSWINIILEE